MNDCWTLLLLRNMLWLYSSHNCADKSPSSLPQMVFSIYSLTLCQWLKSYCFHLLYPKCHIFRDQCQDLTVWYQSENGPTIAGFLWCSVSWCMTTHTACFWDASWLFLPSLADFDHFYNINCFILFQWPIWLSPLGQEPGQTNHTSAHILMLFTTHSPSFYWLGGKRQRAT